LTPTTIDNGDRLSYAKGNTGAFCGVCWIDGEQLTDLYLADNTALLDESRNDLQNLTTQIETEAGSVGLIITAEKKQQRYGPLENVNEVMAYQQEGKELRR